MTEADPVRVKSRRGSDKVPKEPREREETTDEHASTQSAEMVVVVFNASAQCSLFPEAKVC